MKDSLPGDIFPPQQKEKMKRYLCLLLILLVHILIPPAHATAPALQFLVFAEAQTPVYALIYEHPYTQGSPYLQKGQGIYDTVRNKYAISFSGLENIAYDVFFYQSPDGDFSPQEDPSLFLDNDGKGFSNNGFGGVATLTLPRMEGFVVSGVKDSDNSVSITLQSTDGSIDFSHYDTASLYLTLSNLQSSFTRRAATSTSCPIYYCGTIQAQFTKLQEGTFNLIASYNQQTLAYVKNAVIITSLNSPPRISPIFSALAVPSSTPLELSSPQNVLGLSVTSTQIIPPTTTTLPAYKKPSPKSSSNFLQFCIKWLFSILLSIIHAIRSI